MVGEQAAEPLRRQSIVVTVGMGPWPFDRLVAAAGRLAAAFPADYNVFVQRGSSRIPVPCPSMDFVSPEELRSRMAAADVVVSHAGNTLRLVQRAGKVPIAVARERRRGEMGNDHQVRYLEREQGTSRVIGLWGDLDGLAAAVANHAEAEGRLLSARPPPADASVAQAWERIGAAMSVPRRLGRSRWARQDDVGRAR
jgi:UDP-N-acetylglucosamine transferase subunit ALG13